MLERVTRSVRLPVDLDAALVALAARERRSVNAQLTLIVEKALEETK